MTIRSPTELQCFFDPVTLGLHIPAGIGAGASADTRIGPREDSVFVHELCHVMQMYGSVFGYTYLFHTALKTRFFLQYLRHLSREEGIQLPVGIRQPVDLSRLSLIIEDEEERSLFARVLFSERYFCEELYGWTYAYLTPNPLVDQAGQVAKTSPLHLQGKDDHVLSLDGECILESHAMLCENLRLISTLGLDRARSLLDEWYGDLDFAIRSRYFRIIDYFGFSKLWPLAPLLFFTVLNQPVEAISVRNGDYNLVGSVKRVLVSQRQIADLPVPETDDDLQSALATICEVGGLSDPFEALESLHTDVSAMCTSEGETGSEYLQNWVASQVMAWMLSHRLDAIWWPLRLGSILRVVPLVRIYNDSGTNSPGHLNIPEAVEPLLPADLGWSSVRHVVASMMYGDRVRCPAWIHVPPSLSSGCSYCTGDVLTQLTSSGCPAVDMLRKLEISNIHRR